LIELKEENRMIVDDLNKIKKILRQELGYSDEKWRNELQRYQEIWRSHYSLPDEKK
jgi:glycerol-3-phosphate dehydrogenase